VLLCVLLNTQLKQIRTLCKEINMLRKMSEYTFIVLLYKEDCVLVVIYVLLTALTLL
jgi:hypothetical protein